MAISDFVIAQKYYPGVVYSKADSEQTERPDVVSFRFCELIFVDMGPKLVNSIQVSVVSFVCRHIPLVY